MTEMAQRRELGQAVPLRALFTAFLGVSLYGVGGGGGIVWARRIAVENRRWISDTLPRPVSIMMSTASL